MVPRLARILLLTAAIAVAAIPQDEDLKKVHARFYKKVSPAVVGIRANGQKGSGTIVSWEGYILTSPTAVGVASKTCWVYLKGHKRVEGKTVLQLVERELVIVKIDPQDVPGYLELGDSDAVRVGQVSYVLGDSYESIFTDDQVAISVGVVSGSYSISDRKEKSFYTGKVIETSAALNPNQDGGPLLDASGRVIGMMTLNYHESKFAGVAVPINEFKSALAKFLPLDQGWVGISVEDVEEGTVITRVARNGPADQAGLKKGDVLARVGETVIHSSRDWNELAHHLVPGEKLEFEVKRGKESVKGRVVIGKKEVY